MILEQLFFNILRTLYSLAPSQNQIIESVLTNKSVIQTKTNQSLTLNPTPDKRHDWSQHWWWNILEHYKCERLPSAEPTGNKRRDKNHWRYSDTVLQLGITFDAFTVKFSYYFLWYVMIGMLIVDPLSYEVRCMK